MRLSGFQHLLSISLIFIGMGGSTTHACTTAVISGRATQDGRPLLWKNRDTPEAHNRVVHCDDGRYPYVGIANASDPAGLQIWSGLNGAGFAIMNNASYNLVTKGESSTMEGTLMKLALQSCATVQDFQAFLERSSGKGRWVAANFGVIDAQGGAAYFETDEQGFHRFDAADAPEGFLVRGNYSHSGTKGKGTGYLRESRAQDLIAGLHQKGRLSERSLLEEVARDTANPRIDSFPDRAQTRYAYVGDSICRNGISNGTANAFVVRGVRGGEDPGRSRAWVILGNPITGVGVPLWAHVAQVPTELAGKEEQTALHQAFERVRTYIYPDQEDDRVRYLDHRRVYGPQGILPALLTLERSNRETLAEAEQVSTTDYAALEAELARRTLSGTRTLLIQHGLFNKDN